jgi:hypothetical protein
MSCYRRQARLDAPAAPVWELVGNEDCRELLLRAQSIEGLRRAAREGVNA